MIFEMLPWLWWVLWSALHLTVGIIVGFVTAVWYHDREWGPHDES